MLDMLDAQDVVPWPDARVMMDGVAPLERIRYSLFSYLAKSIPPKDWDPAPPGGLDVGKASEWWLDASGGRPAMRTGYAWRPPVPCVRDVTGYFLVGIQGRMGSGPSIVVNTVITTNQGCNRFPLWLVDGWAGFDRYCDMLDRSGAKEQPPTDDARRGGTTDDERWARYEADSSPGGVRLIRRIAGMDVPTYDDGTAGPRLVINNRICPQSNALAGVRDDRLLGVLAGIRDDRLLDAILRAMLDPDGAMKELRGMSAARHMMPPLNDVEGVLDLMTDVIQRVDGVTPPETAYEHRLLTDVIGLCLDATDARWLTINRDPLGPRPALHAVDVMLGRYERCVRESRDEAPMTPMELVTEDMLDDADVGWFAALMHGSSHRLTTHTGWGMTRFLKRRLAGNPFLSHAARTAVEAG